MIALLFPAFGPATTGVDLFREKGSPLHAHFHPLEERIPRAKLIYVEGDELAVQQEWFAYGCAVSDLLRTRSGLGTDEAVVAGYSMGLYAALYHAGVLSFETGLEIIRTVYESIEESIDTDRFLTSSVVGLKRGDIEELIADESGLTAHNHGSVVEIVGCNNRYHYVLAGERDAIDRIVRKATAEGALSAKVLPFRAPYHCSVLRPAARCVVRCLEQTATVSCILSDPAVPVVSSLTGRIIQTVADAVLEIERNIDSPFDWPAAMRRIDRMEAEAAFECGPGRVLIRAGRFIDTRYTVGPLEKLPAILPQSD